MSPIKKMFKVVKIRGEKCLLSGEVIYKLWFIHATGLYTSKNDESRAIHINTNEFRHGVKNKLQKNACNILLFTILNILQSTKYDHNKDHENDKHNAVNSRKQERSYGMEEGRPGSLHTTNVLFPKLGGRFTCGHFTINALKLILQICLYM